MSAVLAATAIGCGSSEGTEADPTTTPPSAAAPTEEPGSAPVPVADPDFLEQYAVTYRFQQGHPGSFRITPEGDAVLFLRSSARSFVNDLWQIGRAHV